MSEIDVVEPVPVTKDPALVNGENGPHSEELQNGDSNKQTVDMSNGVHHDEHNGVNDAGIDMSEPVNGNMNGPEGEDDLMGEGDELPPPPEGESELPPPPPASSDIQEDLLTGGAAGEEVEEYVDELEVVENAPLPAGVSEVDDLIDVSEGVDCVPVDNVEVKPTLDISDEELVSDGGLKDEVDTEDKENQENEAVEQQAEAPLVDISEPPAADPSELVEQIPVVSEPPQPEPEQQIDEVPVEEDVPEIPVPAEQLVSVGYEMVDVEMETLPEVNLQPEPVSADQGSSVDLAPTQEPPVPEPEDVVEPEVVQQVEVEPEPIPEPPQDPIPEPPQEVYQPQPEPVEIIEPELSEPISVVQPGIPEVNITHEEDDEPPVEQAQVGYAEPDIIIDNKPMEEVQQQQVPPPPPPPLDEETPEPPPPLDENVPLKRDRKSGGSTPNKQSPSKEIITPTAPVVEETITELETRQPEPMPVPMMEAVVATQVAEEPAVEPTPAPSVPVTGEVSPPGSPSVVSETALSEERQAEPAEPHTSVSPQVSQKINKKNFKNKIKFGVDLVEAALKQLGFLGTVTKETGLYEEWLFKKAIRRYEAFWLPIVAEHKKESLAAPLDIEWIWHCHMLAPLSYEADCRNLVGLVPEHKLMSEKDRAKALEKSRKYWVAKYPNEPFEIELVYREPEPEPVVVPAQDAQPAESEVAPETQGDNTTVEKQEPVESKEAEGVAPTASEEDTHTEQSEDSKQQESAEQPAEKSTEQPAEQLSEQPAEQSTEQPAEQTTTEAPVAENPVPVEPIAPIIPEEGYEQKCSYNIFSAIKRQRVFCYQVSLPHFHDKNFLKAAVKRYQRFLFLKHQNPTEVLAPCYDIDLIWHTHQLHPSVYKHDTTKVLGQILVHNDSINDRSAGSTLQRADQKTRDLWKTLFEDSFVTFGSTFRGEPPVLCEKMSLIEPSETFAFSTKKATVNLDKVQVEGLPEEVNKYSVKLAYGTIGGDGPLIKQFKGNKKKIEFENIKKGLAHFVFDTKEYEGISFNMSQQIGFACAGHDEEIGQQWFNLMPVVENIPKSQSEAETLIDTVTIDEENNLKATFSASIEPPKQGPTMLFLKNGNYETRFCIMPEQVVQMWGPIPLPRLPAGRDNHCVVASHKFVNHTGEVTFTCRLIHSLPLLMSAVQVFFHSRMAAVAHLVGSDQIPLPSQISDSKKIFSLNPAEGQRGILIKNQTGDWGLIRGQWTGFRKAQPAVAATKGKKAKKEVTWCPGTLAVSFYKIATGAWQHLTLPYAQDSYKFTIQDANVDLKTGTIQISSESNEVAENLALGFSVALLHVICQPRYTPPPPPEPIPVTVEPQAPPQPATPTANEQEVPPTTEADEKQAEGEQEKTEEGGEAAVVEAQPEAPAPVEPPVSPKSPTIKSVKSDPGTPSKKIKELPAIPTFELGLVLAAGYHIETATNDHIKKAFGQNACAGCVAYGVDVGVGQVGETATQAQADVEVAEVAETGDAEDVEDVEQDNIEMADGMDDMGAEGMDAMGDAGGAACGAF